MDADEAAMKLLGGALLAEDRAPGEKAERDLDTLIRKREKARRQTEAEHAREELWAESVRTYNASRDAQLRALWCEYHLGHAERLRANLEALVAYHEEQAERYQPKTEEKGAA